MGDWCDGDLYDPDWEYKNARDCIVIFRDAFGSAYWRTKNDGFVKIVDMTDSHIQNVLNKFGKYMDDEEEFMFSTELRRRKSLTPAMRYLENKDK